LLRQRFLQLAIVEHSFTLALYGDAMGLTRVGALATAVLAALVACERHGAGIAERGRLPSVLNSRSIRVGDSVPRAVLHCSDDTSRTIADSTKDQFVTFMTTADCSECTLHAIGLDSIWSTKQMKIEMLSVAYVHPDEREELLRWVSQRRHRPVCFDTVGTYWDALDLRHTPVSVLLLRGRIGLMHDAPLGDARAMSQLTGDVNRIRVGDTPEQR
jgi:hypothetical protein